MDDGFIINDENGNRMMSLFSLSGAIKSVIETTASINGAQSYPDLIGRSIRASKVSSTLVFDYSDGYGSVAAVQPDVAITYPSGVPTVTWSYVRRQTSDVFVNSVIVVFVL